MHVGVGVGAIGALRQAEAGVILTELAIRTHVDAAVGVIGAVGEVVGGAQINTVLGHFVSPVEIGALLHTQQNAHSGVGIVVVGALRHTGLVGGVPVGDVVAVEGLYAQAGVVVGEEALRTGFDALSLVPEVPGACGALLHARPGGVIGQQSPITLLIAFVGVGVGEGRLGRRAVRHAQLREGVGKVQSGAVLGYLADAGHGSAIGLIGADVDTGLGHVVSIETREGRTSLYAQVGRRVAVVLEGDGAELDAPLGVVVGIGAQWALQHAGPGQVVGEHVLGWVAVRHALFAGGLPEEIWVFRADLDAGAGGGVRELVAAADGHARPDDGVAEGAIVSMGAFLHTSAGVVVGVELGGLGLGAHRHTALAFPVGKVAGVIRAFIDAAPSAVVREEPVGAVQHADLLSAIVVLVGGGNKHAFGQAAASEVVGELAVLADGQTGAIAIEGVLFFLLPALGHTFPQMQVCVVGGSGGTLLHTGPSRVIFEPIRGASECAKLGGRVRIVPKHPIWAPVHAQHLCVVFVEEEGRVAVQDAAVGGLIGVVVVGAAVPQHAGPGLGVLEVVLGAHLHARQGDGVSIEGRNGYRAGLVAHPCVGVGLVGAHHHT